MNVSDILKQLRKKLRNARGRLTLAGWFVLAAATAVLLFSIQNQGASPVIQDSWTDSRQADGAGLLEAPDQTLETFAGLSGIEDLGDLLRRSGQSRDVELVRHSLCGEEASSLGRMSMAEIVKLQEKHPQWRVETNPGGNIVFVEMLDDLSESCRLTAHIGLDGEGTLSLFDGLPAEDNVKRTFFQINVEHMKTSLPREAVEHLYEGIPVRNLAEFNSVLSTFSEFAIPAYGYGDADSERE